jgi:hypothetical protein
MEGATATYSGTMKIKVRGNTTATFAKKPYHIKLDHAASILGLAEEKDWVLLANFLDETLMTNAVALKAGQLLNIPYTNHILAVDVSVNGTYIGNYNLTEQIEVDKNRINIENGGQLIELDQYFDEPWKFRSSQFDLPVMIHYPVLTSQIELDAIQTQFETLTSLVASTDFPNNNYLDYFDEDSFVNYLIVMMLVDNEEINHPKSTYLYKPAGDKYHIGPLWDFDWAYGFESTGVHLENYYSPEFWSPTTNFEGTNFFYRFLKNPQTKEKLQQKWASFETDKLPLLLDYVKAYASTIAPSYKRDYTRWSTYQSNRPPEVNPAKMENWLTARASYLSTYIDSLN